MGTPRVIALRPQEVESLWDELSPYIELALDQSMQEQTLEDVKRKGIEGEYLFLVYMKEKIVGVMTIELYDYPSKRVAGIVHVAGEDFDEWSELADETSRKVAKEQGATEIMIIGRPGWLKRRKQFNYKLQYVVLTSTL